jgi:hypothetical protein
VCVASHCHKLLSPRPRIRSPLVIHFKNWLVYPGWAPNFTHYKKISFGHDQHWPPHNVEYAETNREPIHAPELEGHVTLVQRSPDYGTLSTSERSSGRSTFWAVPSSSKCVELTRRRPVLFAFPFSTGVVHKYCLVFDGPAVPELTPVPHVCSRVTLGPPAKIGNIFLARPMSY